MNSQPSPMDDYYYPSDQYYYTPSPSPSPSPHMESGPFPQDVLPHIMQCLSEEDRRSCALACSELAQAVRCTRKRLIRQCDTASDAEQVLLHLRMWPSVEVVSLLGFQTPILSSLGPHVTSLTVEGMIGNASVFSQADLKELSLVCCARNIVPALISSPPTALTSLSLSSCEVDRHSMMHLPSSLVSLKMDHIWNDEQTQHDSSSSSVTAQSRQGLAALRDVELHHVAGLDLRMLSAAHNLQTLKLSTPGWCIEHSSPPPQWSELRGLSKLQQLQLSAEQADLVQLSSTSSSLLSGLTSLQLCIRDYHNDMRGVVSIATGLRQLQLGSGLCFVSQRSVFDCDLPGSWGTQLTSLTLNLAALTYNLAQLLTQLQTPRIQGLQHFSLNLHVWGNLCDTQVMQVATLLLGAQPHLQQSLQKLTMHYSAGSALAGALALYGETSTNENTGHMVKFECGFKGKTVPEQLQCVSAAAQQQGVGDYIVIDSD